jgi:hypothetical protein
VGERKKRSLKGLNLNNPGFQPGDEMRTKNSVREETGLKSNFCCGRNRRPPSYSPVVGKKERKKERKKRSLKGLIMNNPGFQPGDEMRTKNSVREET